MSRASPTPKAENAAPAISSPSEPAGAFSRTSKDPTRGQIQTNQSLKGLWASWPVLAMNRTSAAELGSNSSAEAGVRYLARSKSFRHDFKRRIIHALQKTRDTF